MLKHYYHKFDTFTTKIFGNTWFAHSFTPTVYIESTGLSLFISKTGIPTGTLTYEIYLANGSGNPIGDVLASVAVSYADTDTSTPGIPLKALFTTVNLVPGIQYVFLAKLSAGNSTNCLLVTSKEIGDYVGGNMKTSTDAGANWTDTSSDAPFDIWDASNVGVRRYYALAQMTGAVRLETIYQDVNYSTVETSFKVGTQTTADFLLKSQNHLYAVTHSNAGSTVVYRYNDDLTLDTTWGISGLITRSGNCYSASVSNDDWLILSTATAALRGHLYQFDDTGTQVWTIDGGVNGNYLSGTVIAQTADFVSLTGPMWGWTSVKRSDGSAIKTYVTGNWVRTEIRESNLNVFGNSGSTVREYPTGGGGYVWSIVLSPESGTINHIKHFPGTNLLFLGGTRENNNSLYCLYGGTGGLLHIFDSGNTVNRIEFDYNGYLLVCGNSGSDGVGTTTFRYMNPGLGVEWRFDENFIVPLVGVVSGFVVPPEIVDQSMDIIKVQGEYTQLFVTATGVPDPSYQWYKNGNIMGGEVLSTLTFTEVDKTDQASYTCIATNVGGTDTSDPIVLTVNYPPELVDQSEDMFVYVEDLVDMSVSAIGQGGTLTYQWYKDGVLISGATSSHLIFTAFLVSQAAYQCIITNNIGSVQSEIIRLLVSPNHYSFTDRVGSVDTQVSVIDKVVIPLPG